MLLAEFSHQKDSASLLQSDNEVIIYRSHRTNFLVLYLLKWEFTKEWFRQSSLAQNIHSFTQRFVLRTFFRYTVF